jgi:hypothetical protein
MCSATDYSIFSPPKEADAFIIMHSGYVLIFDARGIFYREQCLINDNFLIWL